MPAVQSVQAFVDDLLLGPFTNRYKAVMARGTRVEFCFEKDRVLYLGLSADALKPDAETSDIRGGVELIKENIVKNFTNFNKICIFIDGVAVLE